MSVELAVRAFDGRVPMTINTDLLDMSSRIAGIERDMVIHSIQSPNWESGRRFISEGWESHIPEELCKVWESLSTDTKLAAFAVASRVADLLPSVFDRT